MGVLNPTLVIGLAIIYGCVKYLVERAAFLAYPWCDHPTLCFNYSDELLASLDRSVDPCENLYEHVCGRWDRLHPASGQFSLLQARISAFTFGLLEQSPHTLNSDSVRKSVIAFQACRKVHDEHRDDLKVLFDVFEKFNVEWPSLTLPNDFDVMDFLLGLPLDYGISTPFLLTLQPYLKTDKRYGLTLDFSFIDQNETFQEGILQRCIPTISPSIGKDTASTIARRVQSVFQDMFTIILAMFPTGRVMRNYSTVEDMASGLSEPADLNGWLHAINKHLPPDRVIDKHEYVYAFGNASVLLGELLRSTKASDYVDLVLFGGWTMILQLYTGASYPLMKCFHGTHSIVQSAIGCLAITNEIAPYALGRLLFDGLRLSEAVEAAGHTWSVLRDSTKRNFANLTWMDKSTAAGATEHVERLMAVVSMPAHLRSEEALDEFYDYLPTFSQPFLASFFDTVGRRLVKYKRLLRPNASIVVHREDVSLPMVAVNAYYMPINHLMVIPTAIIAPPFVTLSMPKAINYGAIGKVLGHELSHSFDPRLSNISRKGDAITWWSKGSFENFTRLLSCVQDQLLEYTGSPVHARSALSETFADTAGIQKARLAYGTLPPNNGLLGYTQEQLFFVASCFEFCSRKAYEYRKMGLYPAVALRCNLPAANEPRFAAAFGCTEGAVLNPTKRCNFH
ncbi:endothelin-converting enzyme 2-like [Rhipicephalus microplus]|uniref:endothelin-converting enzyme 2-like n=1 Tax=Rhipicephalus microplus TaxID=6941 RepID=UPI003F6CB9FE